MNKKNRDRKVAIEAYLYREVVSKQQNIARILLVLMVLNLLVFGYFGAYKGYTAYKKKVVLRDELATVVKNLETNVAVVNDIEPYVSENSGLDYLNVAIPGDDTLSLYLEELSLLAADNGYELDAFRVTPVDAVTKQIDITLFGSLTRYSDFLRELEYLDRLTIIKAIKVNPIPGSSKQEYRFRLVLEVSNYVETKAGVHK